MKMQDGSTMPKGSYILTKDTVLSQITQDSPKAAELLAEYGLHCVNCFANTMDTLATGAKVHGMTDEELDTMIQEINEELEKEVKI